MTAFVGLGANLGDAVQAVTGAAEAVSRLPDVRVMRCSGLYRTAPQQAFGPDYVNAVIEVTTCLSAPELLSALLALEQAAGRQRPYHNAPRTLDLDLLLYGSARISSPHLVVPHPRMTARAFVLVPLAEIAPERVSAEQLQAVSGQSVTKIQVF